MDKPLGMEIKTYEEAMRWLYDRIDYERIRPSGQSNPFRLERVQQLLNLIGNPHQRIRAVHIAGTKGKGSTAAMIDSILRRAGLRVGLFTSPHIVSFEERMRVNGSMPNPVQLTSLVQQLSQLLVHAAADSPDRPPTFFEITTLLAWMFFDQQHVDIAVLETGLGGRLDCTNVCNPLLTIITSIGLDHTHILGDTIAKIAAEKAGIIKPAIPVIQGRLPAEADAVVALFAQNNNSLRQVLDTDFRYSALPGTFEGDHCCTVDQLAADGDEVGRTNTNRFRQAMIFERPDGSQIELKVPFAGEHQLQNAALAVQAADILSTMIAPSINEQAILKGLADTFWPLRFEVLSYQHVQVIVDAAHNPDSIVALMTCLQQQPWHFSARTLIFASSADKDAASMLALVAPHFDRIILTRYVGNPRSIAPEDLQSILNQVLFASPATNEQSEKGRPVEVLLAPEPSAALTLACQMPTQLEQHFICATGSLFLAAEIRSLICGNTSPFPVFPGE